MRTTNGLRKFLRILFFVVCAIIAAISLGFGMARLGWLEPDLAMIFAFIIVAVIAAWWRLYQLSVDVEQLTLYANSINEYETDIERRLDHVSAALTAVRDHLPQAQDEKLDNLTNTVLKLEHRLSSLENVKSQPIANMEKAASKSENSRLSTHSEKTKDTSTEETGSNQDFDEEMLNLHLQPIVELPSRQPIFFDAFMRLKKNQRTFVDDDKFGDLVTAGGLLPTVEKKVLMSSARMLDALSGKKKRSGLFCRISGPTLSDAKCFREISNFLQSNGQLTDALVLQLSQREYNNLNPRQKERLGSLADLGYEIALDQVKNLAIDADELLQAGIRYLRVPAGILLHSQSSSTPTLPELLNMGVSIIGTDVERETDAVGLLDINVQFASGMLFAPPRPVKSELLHAKGGGSVKSSKRSA